MQQVHITYLLSFQTEQCRKGARYHWMIFTAQKPDELVSWGHAATRELAKIAARNELKDLASGLTGGGRVSTATKHRL